MNRERRSKGLDPYTPNFETNEATHEYGAVANLFALEMAQRLRGFLISYGMDSTAEPADVLMSKRFLKMVCLPKMIVDLQMAYHITGTLLRMVFFVHIVVFRCGMGP
mmetsp:Transcript_10858/g.23155  ORF Transcript_10858/g.23155 Transcript_10858/m.23155 type:complete len:107 (+) Transcript_10858:266-586(+)|eukprot:CAMPEP_0168214112 /NCGR_PEP_ID=MMETSP0140_2-20121125/5174_1 /TAXON_ID=44445 /ORGANISM="Pseudo-nitzschia australis, Strain 10249 10 AB" /LENGTH=106 /DNA_ID=CAMNT_0008141047 /DNA_START=345 /DNA_END=665 /DNA_ORIENTATION=-